MDQLGFIHEKLDIKLLILYILRRLPGTVDRHLLQDFAQCDGGVGYFDYSDCLYELVDSGMVIEEKEGFRISEKGAANIDVVDSSLPFSVRKKVEKLIAPEAKRLLRLSLLKAEHKTENGCCMVTLAMDDGGGEILRMKFLCDGDEQAERIEKNFRKNAETIYAQIVEMMDR